jgi:nitrogenase molybdenum-cofactor synthesis protein NifE
MPWLDINQERHHPYAGYEGMVALVHEIDRAIFNPVWQQVRIPAPWDENGETTQCAAAQSTGAQAWPA